MVDAAQCSSGPTVPSERPDRLRRVGALLLPYLVLVCLHLLSGMEMEQPVILADEVGYLGNARYLSGAGHLPNMRGSQFYHFGYSLLLLPVFWLFTHPVSIYQATITVNALLASSLYFPLYVVLESFLDVPRRAARWIAFTCCLYPSIVLYSNFAWAENAFIPLYAVVTLLFGKWLVSQSWRHALLFGLCAGFLYTIHPRALPVLVIVTIYLSLLALLELLEKRHVLLSTIMVGAVFVLTRVVNGHLKALGWGGGGEFSATRLAGRLVPGSDFPALIERALGQVLYLFQASHGLFLVGVVAVIWMVRRHVPSVAALWPRLMAEPRTGVPIFASLTATGLFIASCASKLYSLHGQDGVRGADFIHGRYNEAFAVLFITFALAEFSRRRLSNRRVIVTTIGVSAAALCLSFVVVAEVDDALRRHDPSVAAEAVEDFVPTSRVRAGAVPGVYPLVSRLGGLHLHSMTLVAILSLLLLTTAMRFTTRGGMILLMLLFSLFALENHRQFVMPELAAARPRLTFVSELIRVGPIAEVSYDVAHLVPGVFYGAQYLLPDTVFRPFDSRKREAPHSEAVISGNKWRQARRLRAKFVVSSGWDNALWLLPGEMQSRLPPIAYEGVTLGAEPKFGFQEAGFHLPERYLGAPARWTNGFAALKVPLDAENPPVLLGVETIVPGRDGAEFQVLANGVELWNERVPAHLWSKTFDLERVPLHDELLIELKSDTSADQRRLGVMVRGIRVIPRDLGNVAAYEGITLGAAPVLGFEESGFYAPERIEGAPGRWTNGAATLTVPLNPRRMPQWIEVETLAPGRDKAQLQVLVNGVEFSAQEVPRGVWSATFNLERIPMSDELLIELKSDTFIPAERHEGSSDTRELGLVVRGIRLLTRDS